MNIKLSDAQKRVIKLLQKGWKLHYNDPSEPLYAYPSFWAYPMATLTLSHQPPKEGIADTKRCDIRTARKLKKLNLIKRQQRFIAVYILDKKYLEKSKILIDK